MEASASREERFVQKLTQIVLDNLNNEQFSVEVLAVTYGISRSQLHKKLKKAVGKSISQFIREIRLDEGLKLLQKGDYTVSEIAYQVGFSSPTYFNTCFREFYGYPPGEVKFRLLAEEGKLTEFKDSEQAISPEPQNRRAVNDEQWSRKRINSVLAVGVALALGIILIIYWGTADKTTEDLSAESSIGKSIAVLPFEDVSSEKDQEAFTNAMVIEISDQLVKIEDLQVLSRSSTQAYKGSKKSTKEIASELGSSNILLGSVQKEGDNVRITVQLVDGGTDTFLWSETFDGKLERVFEMQRTIAQRVADELKIQISPQVQERILKTPTENLQAYSKYLETVGSFGNAEKNIPLLEEAIQLDPRFADAYVRLATEKIYELSISEASPEKFKDRAEQIKAMLHNALSVDPENARGHYWLGICSFVYDWDFEKAEFYHQRAYELQPGAMNITYPWYLLAAGRPEDALQYNTFRVLAASPNNWLAWLAQALCYTYLNNHELASESLEKAKKLGGQYILKHEGLALILCLHGKYDEILQQWELLTEEDYKSPRRSAMAAIAYAKMGQLEPCKTIIDHLKQQSDKSPVGSSSYFAALIYAQNKETDLAFEWLEIAYQNHETEMGWLNAELLFQPLHGDPRWMEILDKVGFDRN